MSLRRAKYMACVLAGLWKMQRREASQRLSSQKIQYDRWFVQLLQTLQEETGIGVPPPEHPERGTYGRSGSQTGACARGHVGLFLQGAFRPLCHVDLWQSLLCLI